MAKAITGTESKPGGKSVWRLTMLALSLAASCFFARLQQHTMQIANTVVIALGGIVLFAATARGDLVTLFSDDFSGSTPFTAGDSSLTFNEAGTGWRSNNVHGGVAPIQNEAVFVTGTRPLAIVLENPNNGTWSGNDLRIQFDWINGLTAKTLSYGLIGFNLHATPPQSSEFFSLFFNGKPGWRSVNGGILDNLVGPDNTTAVNILDDTQTFGDTASYETIPVSTVAGVVNDTVQFDQTFIMQNFLLSDFDYIGLTFSAANGVSSSGHERFIDNVAIMTSIPEPNAFLFGGLVCGLVGLRTCIRRRKLAHSGCNSINL